LGIVQVGLYLFAR